MQNNHVSLDKSMKKFYRREIHYYSASPIKDVERFLMAQNNTK